MPFYGTAVWDPALIIAQVCRRGSSWGGLWRTAQGVGASHAVLCPQIVAVQSLFYVSLGALLLVTLGVSPPVEQPPVRGCTPLGLCLRHALSTHRAPCLRRRVAQAVAVLLL